MRLLCGLLCAWLLLAVSHIGGVSATSELLDGVWDVRTLLPGRGAVAPDYVLAVQPGQWTVAPRRIGRLGRLVDHAAARVGLTYAGVPEDASSLCRAQAPVRFVAERDDEAMHLACQPEWFPEAALRRLRKHGLLHRQFDPAEPLYRVDNGTCTATPWLMRELHIAKLSEDTVLVTSRLVRADNAARDVCEAYFELRHRPEAAGQEASSTSAFAPLAMLFVVVAVRMLPRYLLTRRGQLDATSFRGKNPAKLTPAKRLELLRRQREIIEQMKAEDRANAARA